MQRAWAVLFIHYSRKDKQCDVEEVKLYRNKLDADNYIISEFVRKIESFTFWKECEMKDIDTEYQQYFKEVRTKDGVRLFLEDSIKNNASILQKICNHVCVHDKDIEQPLYSFRLQYIAIH
jgi:hypothetical protein